MHAHLSQQADLQRVQKNLTKQQIRERNQRIVDLLSSACGNDVHLNDLAYFLQLAPCQVDDWMRQHGFGIWMNGRNGHWWRMIGEISIGRKQETRDRIRP